MTSLREQLILEARAFCRRHRPRLTLAGLAERVLSDNKFFARLEAGGGFTDKTWDRFHAYFQEYETPPPRDWD